MERTEMMLEKRCKVQGKRQHSATIVVKSVTMPEIATNPRRQLKQSKTKEERSQGAQNDIRFFKCVFSFFVGYAIKECML